MRATTETTVGLMDAGSVRRVGKGRLLRDFGALVRKDRGNTADMLVYVGEIDRRKVYLEHAYPSMFAFCVKRFRMSEAVAAKRIRAGRAACAFPCILWMIRRGELHLSGVHQLAGHLTEDNHREVLRRAKHRSMREIDELIAEISPKADVASSVRAVPVRRGDSAGGAGQRGGNVGGSAAGHGAGLVGSAARRDAELVGSAARDDAADKSRNNETLSEASRATRLGSRNGNAAVGGRGPRNLTTPLSPRRYKLQVTIGQKARDELAELQNLLSHQIPDGDPAAVVERALGVLLAETKKKKGALTEKPRVGRKNGGGGKRNGGRSRAIPAHVRREVFRRDEGRCAFVDGEGRRCESAWQLEFHHCVPYGRDGPHSTGNIELRCRAHNQFEAELEYGREFMEVRRG
ncbi:MAG: hypothetical protein JRE45_08425 [Deltaproteobacteria bacterium]|nr:hypothetical protein [Deltaproteobacteria bacterium]